MKGFAFALILVSATTASAGAADGPHDLYIHNGSAWVIAKAYPTLVDCNAAAKTYSAANPQTPVGCAPFKDYRGYAPLVNRAPVANGREVFRATADVCADRAHIKVDAKPNGEVATFGTDRSRFEFEKCMTESGQPITGK